MNKTLLSALLITAIGVSSSSMAAFTTGNYSGTQSFSGQVSVPTANNEWQWATGSTITIDKKTSDLTRNGTVLTVPATADTLLLAGQTKAVSIGSTTVSLRPKVELSNADGTPVTIDFSAATANSGKGIIKLKVMPDTGTTPLGEIKLDVKAAGIGFSGQTTTTNPVINTLPLLSSATNTSAILNGVVPETATAAMTEAAAQTWLTSLGLTKTKADLLSDYNTKQGSVKTATSSSAAALDMNANNTYFGAIYGLGVATGDNYVVTFDNPVTTRTTWKSALKISVTYI